MPNPFGKYPISSAVKKYIEATRHFYAPETQAYRGRKLRYILNAMKTLGAPENPTKLGKEDILTWMDWMEKKGLEGSTKRKALSILGDYLRYYDNDCVKKMLDKRLLRMPSDARKEIKHLPEDAIQRIHNTTLTMEGWEGAVARFITMAYPYTGLRPSELRTIAYADLDLSNWTMAVKHPKGERSYGTQRVIGIPSMIRETVADYLEERRTYLEAHGAPENSAPLIPYICRKGVEYWRYQSLENLKLEIEKQVGFKFKLKDYRSSFCQIAIDRGAALQAVSKVMGHGTTKTTESYYGRMRDEPAIAEIERALSKPNVKNLIPPVL
jgi:integrase